jgi:tetratricopeptide (TPR) repeat protein
MPPLLDVAAPLRRRLLDRVGGLGAEGSGLYRSGRHAEAARAYRRAAETAEALGRTREAAEARFWQGVALHGGGRLREALAALSSVATYSDAAAVEGRTRHMSLTRAVLVAADLPAPLASVERALADVERVENHAGSGRRSRLLLAKARLALARGDARQALGLAREGFELGRREDASYALGTYLKEAMKACLRLRDLEAAESLMKEWDGVSDVYLEARRIFKAAFSSMVARHQGDVERAIDLAEHAVELARTSDELSERKLSGEALVRAKLCSCTPEEGGRELGRLLRLRHSEVGTARYEVRLLHADYHAAVSRLHAGLSPVDPESGRRFPPPAVTPSPELATRARVRARRTYQSALRVGLELDRLLECSAREAQVGERLGLLDAVE